MGKGRQHSDEELALIRAQTEQTRGETAAQQQKLALAAQELGLRGRTEAREATTAQAETTRKAELTPYEKLLSLGKLAEPDTQERMNRLRSAVDILATEERSRTAQSQIEGQMNERQAIIAAQREDRAAASRANIQDALISNLSQRGDVPLSTLAETLRAGGQPELATGLEKATEATNEKQFQALKSQIPMMQQKGKVGELLNAPGVSDEMRARLQPLVESTQSAGQPAAPPGYVGHNVVKYAPIDLMNFAAAGENATAVPFMNLLNSLVGAPPVRPRPRLPYDYEKAIQIMGQQ